ncbi:NIPA-like protein 2 [Tachyglossus aculeatus]|uniref:NIPA-like protein 2 n=1 Tax=Tachyglossus aculeatus TaxID=9261 RepID=UPI0018F73166|nr:NIPA-like protein 2 [Tachyglossus aculeatus]
MGFPEAAAAAAAELWANFTYGPPRGAGNGSLSASWYDNNRIHLFGVLLAVAGNLVISISLSIQKYCHLRLLSQENQRPYYQSVMWWCGSLLMAVGELGNFIAYGFAPVTLIAPVGCVSVMGSTVISALFLRENLRSSDFLGVTLTIAGLYLSVTFAPNITQDITARKIQTSFVSWQFLVYVILEIITFCILLYFYKRKGLKHVVILLMLVALLGSMTVISVKAVSGMIAFSVMRQIQLTYPIFYVMLIIMVASCVFQVKFLNHTMQVYSPTTIVPLNLVFFTTSAIIAGIVFYGEFRGAAVLNAFVFLFGCFLSFFGVFFITRDRKKEQLKDSYIDFGPDPGKQMLDKLQLDSNGLSYGTLPSEGDSVVNSHRPEKKEEVEQEHSL